MRNAIVCWILSESTEHYSAPLQALQLLGKLGGRNRRRSREPQELDYKDNTEHGLRLVLTFHPNTSFLVPLDRILAICKAIVQQPAQGARQRPSHRMSCIL